MNSEIIPSRAPDGLGLALHHWPAVKPRAVLCIVHGFGEHGGRYGAMAAHLNALGIAAMAVDLRGHGKSQGGRGVCRAYDELLGDVEALTQEARRLYPDLPHYLLGHSMGGAIALTYGFVQPAGRFDGYLISAPFLRAAEPVPAPMQAAVKLIAKLAPKLAVNFPIDGTKISSIPAQQEAYVSDPLTHGRLSFGLAAGMFKAGEALSARAANWPHKLRLWATPDDRLVDFAASKDFAARTPHSGLTVFDGVQHEMHNDTARDAVYALISDFILKERPA